MTGRRGTRGATPELRHEDAMARLVDYELGRLSPSMNRAMEEHLRTCEACQRRGLRQAVNEKRVLQRKIRNVRPTRRLLSRRGRSFIFWLIVLVLTQVVAVQFLRGAWVIPGLSHGNTSEVSTRPTVISTPTPTPASLTGTSPFAANSTDPGAVSLSPDGKTLLASVMRKGAPVVVLFDVASGKQTDAIPWPGSALPGVLAWSHDGKQVAGADGSVISAWTLPSHEPLWTLNLPQTTPSLRVYDVQAGVVTQRPDPATAFANGTLLQWGANGQLAAAPAGASGPTGVAGIGAPLVGLWQVSGSHIFINAKGIATVGLGPDDASHHAALLCWSPDSRYLLWGIASQPVAIAGAATPSATATTGGSSTTTASTTTPSAGVGVPPPDAVVANLASTLAVQGHGDALIWFSADGKLLAECDSSPASAGALRVYDIALGRAVYVAQGGCAGVSLTTVSWQASGTILVGAAGKPVTLYKLGTTP